MGAELTRDKAFDIVMELAACGMNRPPQEDPSVINTAIAMGFDMAMKFMTEQPEYGAALAKGLRNLDEGMIKSDWAVKASAEYQQVMERYPITSSISEDEYREKVRYEDE